MRSSRLKSALFLVLFLGATWLHATTISGTIKDPSGAVIAGARIEITGGDLLQPIVLSSDGVGRFASLDLKPGKYLVRVVRDGFENRIETVDLRESKELQLSLVIARQQVNISVPGNALAFANSDPIYRQLRGIGFQAKPFGSTTLL